MTSAPGKTRDWPPARESLIRVRDRGGSRSRGARPRCRGEPPRGSRVRGARECVERGQPGHELGDALFVDRMRKALIAQLDTVRPVDGGVVVVGSAWTLLGGDRGIVAPGEVHIAPGRTRQARHQLALPSRASAQGRLQTDLRQIDAERIGDRLDETDMRSETSAAGGASSKSPPTRSAGSAASRSSPTSASPSPNTRSPRRA